MKKKKLKKLVLIRLSVAQLDTSSTIKGGRDVPTFVFSCYCTEDTRKCTDGNCVSVILCPQ